MSCNVEIKARVDDIEALEARVQELADKGPITINQEDTFFHCDSGRLKLRILGPDDGQLIFYRRPDQAGPKMSFYLCSQTSQPETMRQSLELAYGSTGQVSKRRTLYLVGRTRIHLDRVEGLGEFMELEVVLEQGDNQEEGIAEAQQFMKKLLIEDDQLVEGAYVDLFE
jgi:predicted adenylyl cyclase CyaB